MTELNYNKKICPKGRSDNLTIYTFCRSEKKKIMEKETNYIFSSRFHKPKMFLNVKSKILFTLKLRQTHISTYNCFS